MFYTIAEIEKIVNISKSAIYKKIRTEEYRTHLSKKQGITYVDETGLKMIQASLNSFTSEFKEVDQKQGGNLENANFEPKNKEIEQAETDTNKYNERLEIEIDRLWGEIQEKNAQIEKLSRLVENGQVLLKEKSQRDIQLLQDDCEKADIELQKPDESMEEQRKWNGVNSFIKSIFGKSE